MIDTLFYFVDTELEYRRLMQGPDGKPGISPTTIVFVGDSREIYVNGKGYGKTSTNGLLASSEFDSWKGHLNERVDNAINNAAAANDEARRKAEEDLAAAMETIEAALDSTADDINTDILAVRQLIQEAKQQLQDNIDSANLNADEILSELTEFQGTIRNELETSVRDAITNADGRTIWTELNTTNNGLTAVTNRVDKSLDSNGDLKNTSVLQSIIDSGVKNNTAITDIQNKWAVMDENQNLIQWVAAGFRSEANKEGGLARMFATAQDDTQNAISNMKTQIEKDVNDNYVASADLEASVIGIVEDELQVDSLAAIAMKSDVNSATTTLTNRLNTADQDRENIHTSLSQIQSTAQEGLARASLLTNVDENGTYFVNESSLDGAVNSMLAKSGSKSASLIHQMAQADIAAADISSLIGEATSSLATKVEVNEVVNNLTGEIEQRKSAVAGLQAQISGEDGLTNTIAGVNARVTDNEAQLTSIAQWQQGTDTWKAGVVQSANLDGAVAGLIADGTKESGKKTRAAVVATVNDDTSAIKINADHVFIDGAKTTTIGSHYDGLYNNLSDALSTSNAEFNTRANAIESGLSALSTWKNDKGYVADAGLVTETNADHALATVIAKTGEARGQIAAMVEDGVSSITLSADKVHITGNLNVNIQSYFDDQIDAVESDIDALEGTVAGHTTSIAAINTKATADSARIDALTQWTQDELNYKSGLVTEAGLDGAVAQLVAENDDVRANIAAIVDDKESTLKLTADQIYIDASKNVKIGSKYDPTQNGVNTALENLDTKVSNNTTSIAALQTSTTADHATLQGIAQWKNDNGEYLAGISSKAGLDGAVAELIAESGSGAKAGIEAVVDGKSSTLTLSANQIKLDAERTLANTIEATQGHIGGMNIANNSLSSSNGNFSVNSTGKLVAKDAEIEGKIKATSLELVDSKIQTSLIEGLSAVATSGSYESLSGTPQLSAIATSGNYSDLSGTPTIPSKLSQLTNDKGFIDSSALNGYALAANVPTSVTQLTGGANILHTTEITTSETTDPTTGIKTKTINLGDGKSYTTISDNNGFIYTNVGYGAQNSDHTSSYFLVSTDGLLTANNAVIYGTVYATNGSFSGKVESTSGHIGGFEIGGSLLSATDTFHWGNTEAEYFDGEVKRGTIYIASQVKANSICPSNISFPTLHIIYDTSSMEGGIINYTDYVSLPAIKCTLTPNMESQYHGDHKGACETVISPYGIATKSSSTFDEQYDLNNGLEGEPTNWLCSDGSGYLASKNISWDNDGNMQLTDKFVEAILNATKTGYKSLIDASPGGAYNYSVLKLDGGLMKIQHALTHSTTNPITDDQVDAETEINVTGVRVDSNRSYSFLRNDGLYISTNESETKTVSAQISGEKISLIRTETYLDDNYDEVNETTETTITPDDVVTPYVFTDGLTVRGTDGTNKILILPSSIKIKKGSNTYTGLTLSFRIKAVGTYQGAASNYDLTLYFTNGILTGYSTNGFPGSTT